MKTCTFKKALSLLLAVMMVVSCITVLSVGAAAAKWDDNGWKTDAQALYNAYVNKAEWIPVGKNSGNGRYETSNEDAEYIYAFAQDSTKIFAFIEVGAADKDIITLRLDSNRDTLKARTHELVFKWDAATSSYKQEKIEYGTDVDDNSSVTNGKFGEEMADYAGTAFMKGNSYEYATIRVNKNYTGADATARDAHVLVLQLRKDRLQGNKGSGDFDHVEKLGFDIEVNYNNTSILHTSNYNADPKADATDFNIYNVKNDRVERFTLDGKISGNEFWKNNAWQLVTGLNGQLIGNFDQTDIAYDFQVTGDSKNIYIAARLYGESYKDGDKASSFKVYLNIDEENAKRGGYEPTAVLEFVFDGKEYAFVNDSRGDFAHLETATTIAADGHAEIEIKIPYRDLKLVSYDLKDGDPYNYLGVNFEFTAPATYSNEQELATLVARTYGKDADHPAKNCAKNLYFTFNSNYAQYSTENYYVGKFNAKDYGNELAFECGVVSNFNDIDKVVNELSDDYKANKQVIVYRVSDALKSGNWTNGKPGENDNKPASFISTYFDYLVYSDGTNLYAIDKGYVELMGIPANRNNYAGQNSGNHVRFWFSDENYWNNNQKFLIVDSAVNFKDTYNNATDMYVWAHTSSWAAVGGDATKIEHSYLLGKDFYITAVKIPVAELKLTTDTLYYAVTNSFYTKVDSNKNVITDSRCQITSGRFIGYDNDSKYTASHIAYRAIDAKNPANKLARVAYTADEKLKKNIIADVYYDVEGIGSYVDTIVNPAITSLNGIAMRGRLNDGIYDNGAIDGSDASKNFSVALKNHNGTNAPVYSADAANEISFKLLRSYDIAGFKAVFRRLVSWGIKNPNYVDVYVTNDSGDTQRVGRFYGKANSDDTLVSYDIVLNKAVKGNKITFMFDSEGPFIFATEFQAYAYGDLVVTTNGANVNNGGYDPAMLFAQNANGYNVSPWWSAKNFEYDENLGAYYAVSVSEPTGSGSTLGVYKNGDFAIQYHSNAASDKATAAQKALYNLISSVAFGERVYLYNNAHADANYDLMMQPSDKENNNFFITIGNAYMGKNMTAYDPTVGYVYNFTDLAQIGSGKTSMIIVDSQSVPDSTRFDSVALPKDSFSVGGLLGDQTQSLWNYYVAIVEFDGTNYYVASYMGAISRGKDESDSAWAARQAADNTAKRALSFGTQGFAILSLDNGEFTNRLSRMWANDYRLDATTDTVKNPDVVYLYDVDLDALRLSYGNAGALSAKVTFNNKNGKNNVTTTESWIDLAESSMNDLRARWMRDLAAIRSQVSAETYAQLERQIENNLKYVRAYGLFANKFNSHEYTAGTRANPWVLYDGITAVENLSFDENLFTLYNRNTIFIEGAKQTAGIMLMNSDKNYEAKSEFNGFKRFAALHDNNYTQLNYLNKITYTFYYDFANSYSVPESLRVYTSANYSFMNHTKPNYEVTLTDKTSDDGKAYPTEGAGTWTITIDMPLVKSTAIYTEFDFTSKQLAVVEINEKCVISDLMGSEVADYMTEQSSCVVTVDNKQYPAVTIDAKADSIVIKHDHSKHNASGHTCTTECFAMVTNGFYGNTFVDLSKTPYLSINMEVPANLTETRFELVVWYNGASRIINLSNIIAREAKDGKVDYFFNFADFCKNTYGMTLKNGELLQLNMWGFATSFSDSTAGTVKINALKFVGAEDTKSEIKAGSDLKLDADKKLLILDKQYKEDALRQEFNGEIIVEGTAKSGFVGTGAKVTVNGDVYTVVLYGDLNGDGAINPADYIIVRKALLKTVELDEIQTVAAIGPKASKVTATTYIQIRQHILGTYNFFAGEKVAQ